MKGLTKSDYLQSVLNSVCSGVIAINSNNEVSFLNSAAESMLGIFNKEELGRNIEEIFFNAGLIDVLEKELSTTVHITQINGIMVLIKCSPIVTGKKVTGAVALFQDISELNFVTGELDALQKKNREMEAILDSSYDGIWVTDGEGNTLYVNSGYEKFSGIKKEKLIGVNLNKLVDDGYYSD